VTRPDGPTLSRQESEALAQRRRGRNWLLLVVLLGIAVLFYLIAIAKLSSPDLGAH
jgi:hypothetical protein